MGKVVGGQKGGVENASSLQAHLVSCWLRLATTGYYVKALRQLLGKLQWAVGPGSGAQPFLAGAYRWLFLGPLTTKCTPPPPPPKVPRGLLEGIACAVVPWRPHNSLPSVTTMLCDAACQGGPYYVGRWGHELGMRMNQEAARLGCYPAGGAPGGCGRHSETMCLSRTQLRQVVWL